MMRHVNQTLVSVCARQWQWIWYIGNTFSTTVCRKHIHKTAILVYISISSALQPEQLIKNRDSDHAICENLPWLSCEQVSNEPLNLSSFLLPTRIVSPTHLHLLEKQMPACLWITWICNIWTYMVSICQNIYCEPVLVLPNWSNFAACSRQATLFDVRSCWSAHIFRPGPALKGWWMKQPLTTVSQKEVAKLQSSSRVICNHPAWVLRDYIAY
jgi:hypothetical protein